MTATATVSARGRARIVGGLPWVFRQDVVSGPSTDAASDGPPIVLVRDERGRPLAFATWAAQARIALRVLGRAAPGDPTPELGAIIESRLAAARARRGGLALERNAYRLIHGESDALPGLFVDLYDDAAVVQTISVAMDAARAVIAEHLRAALGVRVVVERNDGSARDFEGLPRRSAILVGQGPTQLVYQLGPNALEADLLTDGKTGGFLDQADNHAAVAALAPRGAACLDAFTYHGGFALALARRGGAVLATDEDPNAVARATANARRNQLANLEVQRANAFDLLRSFESEGRRFDVVVLDPPAFAKRGSGPEAADRAYKEIILRGVRVTAPGGLTVACSCSGRVTRAHFDDLVTDAAGDSGRTVQVLERRGAGRDHPELAGVPETGHLKCWVLRVL